MDNTTNAILIIVERNERVVTPDLTEDLGAVAGIGMENTIYLLACSDAVCVVGIFNVVKLFELTSLFPSQSMTEVRGMILFYHLRLEKSNKTSAPRKKCGENSHMAPIIIRL